MTPRTAFFATAAAGLAGPSPSSSLSASSSSSSSLSSSPSSSLLLTALLDLFTGLGAARPLRCPAVFPSSTSSSSKLPSSSSEPSASLPSPELPSSSSAISSSSAPSSATKSLSSSLWASGSSPPSLSETSTMAGRRPWRWGRAVATGRALLAAAAGARRLRAAPWSSSSSVSSDTSMGSLPWSSSCCRLEALAACLWMGEHAARGTWV